MALPQRTLGPWEVSAMGLGCMPLSGLPIQNADIVNRREDAIAVIHAALDAGITLIDTADIYAPSWDTMGHNEILVGQAFKSWPGSDEAKSKVIIATKGGITRGPNESWGRDSSRDYLQRAVEASAERLGVERIRLWQHHRLDPSITFEDQFENVLSLLEQGLIERIGVSNYNAEQIRRAIKMGGTVDQGGVVSVQNEFSPRYRNDSDAIDICEESGLAFLPWSPLSGARTAHNLASGEFGAFDVIGESKGVSAYAIAIAWLLHTSSTIIPIPGTTKVSSIRDDVTGLSVSLTSDEMTLLNASLPENAPIGTELIDQPAFRG